MCYSINDLTHLLEVMWSTTLFFLGKISGFLIFFDVFLWKDNTLLDDVLVIGVLCELFSGFFKTIVY